MEPQVNKDKSPSTLRVGPEIQRDHVLDTIEEQVCAGYDALIVEGEEGFGKTTLLRAYARRNPQRSILVELTVASKYGYDPELVIQNICTSADRILKRPANTGPDTEWRDEADLRAVYSRLSRRFSGVPPFVLIIDGLHDIPREDEHVRGKIVSMLPLGMPNIVVIFSDGKPLSLSLKPQVHAKPIVLNRFSAEESRAYLHDMIPSPEVCFELHKLVGGRPGSLAIAYRLLQNGLSPQELLSNKQGSLESLIAAEWKVAGVLDDTDLRMIAAVALARSPLAVQDVARVVAVTEGTVYSLLKRVSFMAEGEGIAAVTFPTEAVRQYALQQTAHLRSRTLDALIIDSQCETQESAGRHVLPQYFQDAGRLDDLIGYLSPLQLKEMLADTKSLQPIEESLRIGLQAAQELGKDAEIYRFSLHKSGLREVQNFSGRMLYVQALIALDSEADAIHEAESVKLASDRLILLSAVAEGVKRHGREPSSQILERIKGLVDEVEAELDVDQSVLVARSLLALMPDRAIALLRKAASRDGQEKNVDWVLARMAIQAAVEGRLTETSRGQRGTKVASITSEIKDPAIERLTATLTGSLSSITAAEAIGQVGTIASARDQIFFLRQWTSINHDRDDALDVTRLALDLVIRTPEYSPNASDMLEIARPLIRAKNTTEATDCVLRIESMLEDLAERGPTAALHRLRFMLAGARYRWAMAGGEAPLEAEYYVVHAITDKAIRSECFARFIAVLTRLDVGNSNKALADLRRVIESDLIESIGGALGESADHVQVAGPVISALSRIRLDIVEKVIDLTNTKDRREALRLMTMQALLQGPIEDRHAQGALRVLEGSETTFGKSSCAEQLWQSLSEEPKRISVSEACCLQLVPTAHLGYHVQDRALCYARAIAVSSDCGWSSAPEVLAEFSAKLNEALKHIDAAWDRIDTALQCSAILAKAALDPARACLSAARSAQADLKGSGSQLGLVLAPTRLAIATLAGLMKQSLDHASDRERILNVVSRIPSAVYRSWLRAELAVWYWAAGRRPEAEHIVQNDILPELRMLESSDKRLYSECVVVAADAVFASRPSAAYSLFRTLEAEQRDRAIYRAARARINRMPASEPFYEHRASVQHLGAEDVDELLAIARMCDSDRISSGIISRIAEPLAAERRSTWSPQVRGIFAKQVDQLAEDTTPRPGWISHAGYTILWRSYAKRIKDGRFLPTDPLCNSARAIPNAADRSFVLSCLALLLKPGEQRLLLEDALKAARSITVGHEQVYMLSEVAEQAFDVDFELGKHISREVSRLVKDGEHGDPQKARRRLVDMAFNADPKATSGFAEALDTDETRIAARSQEQQKKLKDHYKRKQQEKALLEDDGPQVFTPQELDRLPSLAWDGLGRVNAGRVNPKSRSELRRYLAGVANLPLDKAYPVLAWALGNLRVRSGDTDQAASTLKPFLEASLAVAELGTSLTLRDGAIHMASVGTASAATAVGLGESDIAKETIAAWIRANVSPKFLLVDPFMSAQGMWIIKQLARLAPECEITVLTSHAECGDSPGGPRQAFRDGWSLISDDECPWVEFVLVECSRTNTCPIHDRGLFTDKGGLKFGTSVSGFGAKESVIMTLDSAECGEILSRINPYLLKTAKRSASGAPLSYVSFTL